MLRPVPGFLGYFVSEEGEVFSNKNGALKKLKQGRDPAGYPQHGFSVGNGRVITLRVHKIVASAWLPPPPSPEHVIRHRDGNNKNNRADNLLWGTQQENIDDKRRHGTLATGDRNGSRLHPESIVRGSRSNFAKLSEEQVAEIRARLAQGEKGNAIARDFGVAKTTISAIKCGKNWRLT